MLLDMSENAATCTFEHPGLAALDRPVFRLTEGDRVAALAIQLDGSEAVVPLVAVLKLFSISPDSADGQMLHLIGRSLKFVSCLKLGDPLPAEVLTGDASWQPSDYHRQIASARLQLQLVNWLGGGADGQQITSHMLVVSIDDPSIRPRVQAALRQAASALAIEGGGEAVAALIEQLAVELAYIEALRERLLARVQGLVRRLNRFAQDGTAISPARRETLLQVSRLAALGLAQIAAKFDEIDTQTGEIISALQNLERQRSFLRPSRDWLFSTQIAWDPVLQEWEVAPASLAADRIWKVLERLYRFLAPRYMAVQEWQNALASPVNLDRTRPLTW